MNEEKIEAPPLANRAERRRLLRGEEKAGVVVCKFCLSHIGTYIKKGNRFICNTKGCRGGR